MDTSYGQQQPCDHSPVPSASFGWLCSVVVTLQEQEGAMTKEPFIFLSSLSQMSVSVTVPYQA